MWGAIVGDVLGSAYETDPIKTKHVQFFVDGTRVTDDSVLTLAQMEQILDDRDWVDCLKEWARRYPRAGYGGNFLRWAAGSGRAPYQSWGNGSAMRVSPVAWAYGDLDAVLAAARESAVVTHSHEEGIRGAQATAAAVYLARVGRPKSEIRHEVESRFGYDLTRRLDDIRPSYRFDVSCQGSVPESLIAFLESRNFEDAVRGAISLGGDADTMACIAGAVAEAFYGAVPGELAEPAWALLDETQRGVLRRFYDRYGDPDRLPA